MNRPRMVLAILVAASAIVAALPAGARGDVVDKGSFKIFRNDRALGAETFEIVEVQDSLVVRARQFLTLPTSRGDEPFEKGADILVNRNDFALRQYQSTRTYRGVTTVRALVVADTHYVAYREGEGRGEGESRILPPGRLFVMDSQVVTLFDLLCRSLQGTSFASRPINLLALGPRDTMLDARAVVLGSETIRWGSRPVVARKLQLVADSQTTFTLWVGSQGQLLRLSEPVGGLRAERDPPAVKRRPPPPPPPPKPGG
ncbi:MAG: hypothetical protein AAB113_11325 [Candidatus Eisenbacteria bacterium]